MLKSFKWHLIAQMSCMVDTFLSACPMAYVFSFPDCRVHQTNSICLFVSCTKRGEALVTMQCFNFGVDFPFKDRCFQPQRCFKWLLSSSWLQTAKCHFTDCSVSAVELPCSKKWRIRIKHNKNLWQTDASVSQAGRWEDGDNSALFAGLLKFVKGAGSERPTAVIHIWLRLTFCQRSPSRPLLIHGISPGMLVRWFPLVCRLGVLGQLPGGFRCW